MGFAQTATMLREALQAEDLGAYRELHRTVIRVQQDQQSLGRLGQQLPEAGILHHLQDQESEADQHCKCQQGGHQVGAGESGHFLSRSLHGRQTATGNPATLQVLSQCCEFHGRCVNAFAE